MVKKGEDLSQAMLVTGVINYSKLNINSAPTKALFMALEPSTEEYKSSDFKIPINRINVVRKLLDKIEQEEISRMRTNAKARKKK